MEKSNEGLRNEFQELASRMASKRGQCRDTLDMFIVDHLDGLQGTGLLDYMRSTFPASEDDLKGYTKDYDYVMDTILGAVTMIRKLPSLPIELSRDQRRLLKERKVDLSHNYNHLINICALNILRALWPDKQGKVGNEHYRRFAQTIGFGRLQYEMIFGLYSSLGFMD